MNLVIDVGNTLVKSAVFEDTNLLEKSVFEKEVLFESIKEICNNYAIDRAILSTVSKIDPSTLEKINQEVPLLVLNNTTSIPFLNLYKTPETLGIDRIALMAGAVGKFPDKNVLVIDAGTCITYDFINSKKEYLGGSISPGIEMRYKSLNTFTANLPKLSLIETIPPLGNSTENAIHIGVLNGVIQEIEGVINQFKSKNQKLTLVLTGGNTNFLSKNLKSTIFANPNILLEGLNNILIHNIDE